MITIKCHPLKKEEEIYLISHNTCTLTITVRTLSSWKKKRKVQWEEKEAVMFEKKKRGEKCKMQILNIQSACQVRACEGLIFIIQCYKYGQD